MYNSNRFKYNEEVCKLCMYKLGEGCISPGRNTRPLPCDPVDRLYDLMKPKKQKLKKGMS